MSRRQVDQAKRSKAMDHGQQAIWNEVRKLSSFTITDIWHVVEMHRKSIINYVKRLEAGGYVEKSSDFARSYKYRLIKDAGQTAPRLTREGDPVTQGSKNENVWRSMRMLKEFSPQDLLVHSQTEKANVQLTTVKAYCTMLSKAGYLRVMQKAKAPIRQAVYKLVRNTGPRPPQIQRVKQVYDPNLGEVTYFPEAAE